MELDICGFITSRGLPNRGGAAAASQFGPTAVSWCYAQSSWLRIPNEIVQDANLGPCQKEHKYHQP